MSTIISQNELVRRAAAFVAERLAEARPPEAGEGYRPSVKMMMAILDEAGMRFNLSPTDARALHDLFHGRD